MTPPTAPLADFSDSSRERARTLPILAPQRSEGGASYYGIPFLKRPTWRWHIAGYFFCGGLSGASLALGALADLVGGRRARPLRRSAYAVALVTLLPCPPLLIWDLGRPERFHHMLRVWKPSSPMNLGAWIFSAFGAVATVAGLHAAGDSGTLGPFAPLARRLPARALAYPGLPLGLAMTGYGGALVAGTSVPAWNQTPLLGAVFVASSFASASEAIRLEFAARREDHPGFERALRHIGLAAIGAETFLLALHILRSGRAGRALYGSRHGAQLMAALCASWIAGLRAPAPRRLETGDPAARRDLRPRRWPAALLGLAGAFLLRWAIVHAGRAAADDPGAAHAASRPSRTAPGGRRGEPPCA